LGPLGAAFAVGAGVPVGSNPLGDAVAVALVVGVLISIGILMRAQSQCAD